MGGRLHVIGLDLSQPRAVGRFRESALRGPGLYRTLVERDQLVHRAELCKVGERAADDNPATIQPYSSSSPRRPALAIQTRARSALNATPL